MNFLWMEYFVAVAEAGSIRSAAKKLYVSEQTISETLRKLQKELDVQLFSHTRPRTLTEAGKIFHRRSNEILQIRKEMLREIYDQSSRETQTLRIGTGAQGTPPFMEPLIALFQQKYPHDRVEICPQRSNLIEDFFGADLYLMPVPVNENEMTCEIMFRDYLCLAVQQSLLERTYGSNTEALCQRVLETRDHTLLSDLPLILIVEETDLNDSLHKAPEFDSKRKIRVPTVALCTSLCLGGHGAAFVMQHEIATELLSYPREQTETLRFFPVDYNQNQYILAFGYPKNHTPTPLERRFLQTAREFFNPHS